MGYHIHRKWGLLTFALQLLLSMLTVASCKNNPSDYEPWYTNYHSLGHSGGGYNTMVYTDSLEAWTHSYAHGTRVFDADLNFTSDDVLVLRHEWNDDLGQENCGNGIVPDYETFMSTPIFPNRAGGSLTPMDATMLLRFLDGHPDCYAACDTKTDTYKTYSALAESAKSLGLESVLDRIIVSFYWKEDKAAALRAHDFKHFALRYYFNNFNNFNEVKELAVPVCMVWRTFIRDDHEWRVLVDNGITVWTAVVDDADDWKHLKSLGVSGCVTNFLYEDEAQ